MPALLLSLTLAAPAIFVDVSSARDLIRRGAAVLDARHDADDPYLPNARELDWLDFRDGTFRTGRLDTDHASVARRLESLGISTDRPVLVYGSMQAGWGDEGRVWWMLRYLGHPAVYILDGGIKAWRAAGLPLADDESDRDPPPSRFVINLQPNLRADHTAAHRAMKTDTVLLDVRTPAEFRGDTPYFSPRGGHVPTARNLDWKTFVTKEGRLDTPARIRTHLKVLGATESTRIITYCTGGVRSAFAQAALLQAGFTNVQNYDGSWWDWSARDELPAAR